MLGRPTGSYKVIYAVGWKGLDSSLPSTKLGTGRSE
jgi:hypothetical protein